MNIFTIIIAEAQDVELAKSFINKVSVAILDPLIGLAFIVAIVVFIWGIIGFINALNAGGDTKPGKSHMIWGIVGITIMASAYGIIRMVQSFTESIL